MIWALIITGIMVASTGKLVATQHVMAFANSAECEIGPNIVRDEMLKQNPTARVIIGCVPIEKPVKS